MLISSQGCFEQTLGRLKKVTGLASEEKLSKVLAPFEN
jgi:hypothetical protein